MRKISNSPDSWIFWLTPCLYGSVAVLSSLAVFPGAFLEFSLDLNCQDNGRKGKQSIFMLPKSNFCWRFSGYEALIINFLRRKIGTGREGIWQREISGYCHVHPFIYKAHQNILSHTRQYLGAGGFIGLKPFPPPSEISFLNFTILLSKSSV